MVKVKGLGFRNGLGSRDGLGFKVKGRFWV